MCVLLGWWQVEFYFGDTNLATDNHLQKLIRNDKEGFGELPGSSLRSKLCCNCQLFSLPSRSFTVRPFVCLSQLPWHVSHADEGVFTLPR